MKVESPRSAVRAGYEKMWRIARNLTSWRLGTSSSEYCITADSSCVETCVSTISNACDMPDITVRLRTMCGDHRSDGEWESVSGRGDGDCEVIVAIRHIRSSFLTGLYPIRRG